MTLRGQMLVAGLLMALLPLSGWQSVRELDASLREGRIAAQRLALAELELELHGRGLLERYAIDEPVTSVAPARVPTRAPLELYAEHAVAPIQIDGYADDWRELGGAALRIADEAGSLEVRAAERSNRLYLMIDLIDDTPVYHRPPRLIPDAGEGELPDDLARIANGDAVQLLLQVGDVRQHGVLSPIAPGELTVQAASAGAPGSGLHTGTVLPGWQAAWTDRPGGHRIEISVALPEADGGDARLGIAAIDVPASAGAARVRASVPPLTMRRLHRTSERESAERVPRLYREDAAFDALLRQRVPAGARVRAFDRTGRLLADVDRLNGDLGDAAGSGSGPENVLAGQERGTSPFASLGDAILFRIFAYLVAGDMPLPERAYAGRSGSERPAPGIRPESAAMRKLLATQRYVTPELDRVLGTFKALGAASARGTALPTAAGWLWYESNEEHSATYAGSRLARVVALLFLMSVMASLLCIAWASWLSLRIRRLSKAAMRAVAADGRVRAEGFPSSHAADEIGDLSRHLGTLLQRSGDYHRYLEALGGRLSHELRTPLAVLAGCLEHLRGPHGLTRGHELLQRADGAAQELDSMIEALLAATRLEQTLQRADKQRLSLDPFLLRFQERQRLREHALAVELERLPAGSRSPTIVAAPELLVQAMDKLMDNAIDFNVGSHLALVRRIQGSRVFIGVGNRMSPRVRQIDAATRREWFEPAVSRRGADGHGHLGLGLHLVELVARHHGGEPDSIADAERLAIGMWLPLADAAGSA